MGTSRNLKKNIPSMKKEIFLIFSKKVICIKILTKKTKKLHYGDVTDSISISQIIKNVQPDEIYNLAAVACYVSFEVKLQANADL